MLTAARQAHAPVSTLSLAIAGYTLATQAHATFFTGSSAPFQARNIYLNRDLRSSFAPDADELRLIVSHALPT
ncbi:hypothetical protein NG726_00560 [Pseudomonas sp. MOB-449]|nr:hypothetical protein [Pseudomonas sp. MOB-449]